METPPSSDPFSPSAQQQNVPPTPSAIRELKNYNLFSSTRPFRQARIRRDSFIAEHRSIGVFTSGGDCSGPSIHYA